MNYLARKWKEGDIITSEGLNNLENNLSALSTEITDKLNKIRNSVDSANGTANAVKNNFSELKERFALFEEKENESIKTKTSSRDGKDLISQIRLEELCSGLQFENGFTNRISYVEVGDGNNGSDIQLCSKDISTNKGKRLSVNENGIFYTKDRENEEYNREEDEIMTISEVKKLIQPLLSRIEEIEKKLG